MLGDSVVCPGGVPVCRAGHVVVLVRSQVYRMRVYLEDGSRLSLEDLERCDVIVFFCFGFVCICGYGLCRVKLEYVYIIPSEIVLCICRYDLQFIVKLRYCFSYMVKICRQLEWIVQDVLNQKHPQPPICILTADQRDHWARAYQHLRDLSPQNQYALDTIEEALFAICLDDQSHPSQPYDLAFQHNAHGGTGHNRWYDKAISILCASDGRAGMNGEHSPCDALIPSRLMDHLVAGEPARDPPGVPSHPDLLLHPATRPHLLEWQTDAEIDAAIRHAEATALAICEDADVGVLHYEGYGSVGIRDASGGKTSADAWVQMAMQLAYFRMHGRWCGTYETGSTRAFRMGRTECIRTCSVDSVRFVQVFDREGVSVCLSVCLCRGVVGSRWMVDMFGL